MGSGHDGSAGAFGFSAAYHALPGQCAPHLGDDGALPFCRLIVVVGDNDPVPHPLKAVGPITESLVEGRFKTTQRGSGAQNASPSGCFQRQ